MEVRSNLYYICCTYEYPATCVYKWVLICDVLWALAQVQQIMQWRGTWFMFVMIAFTLAFAFLAVKSIQLLMGFTNNSSTGILHTETTNYLKLRMNFVYLIFLEGLLIVIFAFIWTSFNFGVLLVVLPVVFIVYFLQGWGMLTFQKSLQEANDRLGGTSQTNLNTQQVI